MEAVDVVPKFHAHLSPFSMPELVEYQALPSGSVVDSSISCEMMLAIESAPGVPFGLGLVAPHADAHWVSASPMKAYLISLPLMVALVCQPQYCVQKPEVSVVVLSVKTK